MLDVEYGAGRSADLEVVRVDAQGEQPVANENVGLPASVVLTANGPQALHWTPRAAGLSLPVRLEVRTAGQPLRVAAQLTLEAGIGSSDEVPRELPIARAAPGEVGNGLPYPEAEPLSVREIGPTPLGGAHAVLVTMPGAGPAHVALYDVLGRRVRVLRDETLPKGATIAAWDGKDDTGNSVRRGVYFARVTTPFGRAHARFLVLQ